MNTSDLMIDPQLQDYIRSEVTSGRFSTEKEVIEEALWNMMESKKKLARLQAHLAEGEEQARRGEFVDNLSMHKFINTLK